MKCEVEGFGEIGEPVRRGRGVKRQGGAVERLLGLRCFCRFSSEGCALGA